jgi:hypothetical protein
MEKYGNGYRRKMKIKNELWIPMDCHSGRIQMKKLRTAVIIVAALVIYSLTYARESSGHFFDVQGKPLAQYDSLFAELYKYFKDSVPERITVVYTKGSTSRFNDRDELVLINETAARIKPYQVIGHESAHLCMANLTKRASTEEQFRFFDEGFASIFENILDHKENQYKDVSLKYAAGQNQQNNLSFEKVQAWSRYFGSPPAANWRAYNVGASFVYYVIDTYGIESFLALCKDIGNTRNLNQSCQNIFHKEQSTIEAEWQEYLSIHSAMNRVARLKKSCRWKEFLKRNIF